MSNLPERLRSVSNMINMGEKIQWGEETALMDEAAACIDILLEAMKTFPRNSLSCHIETHFAEAMKPYEYSEEKEK